MALPVVQMHILLTNNKSHLINDPLALTRLPLRREQIITCVAAAGSRTGCGPLLPPAGESV